MLEVFGALALAIALAFSTVAPGDPPVGTSGGGVQTSSADPPTGGGGTGGGVQTGFSDPPVGSGSGSGGG